jgi:serine/threonine protein kinase/Tol biopolymer transport system component
MVGGELVEDTDGSGAAFGVGTRVAGYRLEEQVGAGGMAVVFRARDERLGRLVALKIMAPALAADEVFQQRFIREWRAAAAVDDPHIIPVYEAGQAGRVLFLAMRFVGGGDVRSLVRREGPLAPGRATAIISSVASALDAAHNVGLVHRDVKPANMLLDGRPGRPDHVYLSDFGLSKGALSAGGLTGSGQFLGTPNYTAPEQIEGLPVDGRADQYALACAAFELLTGAPPFRKDDAMAVIYAQVSEPPPRLTSRRPDLPQQADRVFARALAKAPQNRYTTCGGFANVLRETLGLEPYHLASDAVPAAERSQTDITWESGPGSEAADLAYPVPRPAGANTQAATITSRRVTTQRGPQGDEARHRRRTRRRVAPAVLAGTSILAVAAVAVTILINPLGHDRAKRSGNAAAKPPSYRIVSTLINPKHSAVAKLAFSPDGKTLATGTTDNKGGKAYLWDLATRRRAATMDNNPPKHSFLTSMAFNPDGKTLATSTSWAGSPTGGSPGNTYLWDVATSHRTATLASPAPGSSVYSVAFSPDGKTLATGITNDEPGNNVDGNTYLWDVATGHKTATLASPGRFSSVRSVAFSPDGKTLAVGGFANRDGKDKTYLWDVATRRLIATLTNPIKDQHFVSPAFSPDGKILATGDGEGRTYLWDVATRRLIATLTDSVSTGVNSMAFSFDGKTLATGSDDGRTYLWDVATRRLTATLTNPGSNGVASVAFSPDGKTLATGDWDGSAYLWGTR